MTKPTVAGILGFSMQRKDEIVVWFYTAKNKFTDILVGYEKIVTDSSVKLKK